MSKIEFTNFPPLEYAANEAYNTLCTNLTFSGRDIKKIMATSSRASEGKSSVSMNLMRSMAARGKTVVLADTDLRRSEIASRYGLRYEADSARFGLSHYLAGMAEIDDVLYDTNIKGASFVPIGHELLNPIPLLTGERFPTLLDTLAQRFDYVFVDASPVGVVIDAAEIAKSCDGILLLVAYNEVHRQELVAAKAQLEQTGCPILGTVLNKVEYDSYLSKKYYYKSQYYSSYYTSKTTSEQKG